MKIILFANTDWYLYNYRLLLADELRKAGHDVLLLSPAGIFSSKILAAGFHWQAFELSRSGVNPINEISAIIRLEHLYRLEKPDLVHHFTSKCVLYGSVAARLAGVKQVVNAITGMGYIFTRKNIFTSVIKPFVTLFYKTALNNSKVIFQNQRDMDFFVQMHLAKSEQCVLIPGSGVDLNRFKPLPIAKVDRLVILPARMLWDKGIGEFVDAARLVKSSGIKARFVLVGAPDEGNPTSIPEPQLKAWQESGFVEWWGWKEDMANVYQQATIVCLPSYREGLAKSLIEAAACGCPLVASDIPGCRELVKNNHNGLLVPPHDAQSLAEAIIQLLSDKDLLLKMGKESRQIAVNQFSIEKINRMTLDVYKIYNNGKTLSRDM